MYLQHEPLLAKFREFKVRVRVSRLRVALALRVLSSNAPPDDEALVCNLYA